MNKRMMILLQFKTMLESSLVAVGDSVLNDCDDQMDQMNDKQIEEFITRKSRNPFQIVADQANKLAKEYEDARNDPNVMKEAVASIQEQTGLSEEEIKEILQLTDETESNDDDDKTTKH